MIETDKTNIAQNTELLQFVVVHLWILIMDAFTVVFFLITDMAYQQVQS